jgi:putative membrane protein
MMWYWGNGPHWWGWLVGAVVMVAFWGVVVWAVWYVATSFGRRQDQGTPQDQGIGPQGRGATPGDARRILDERLARGEIDVGEYERLRDVLEGGARGQDRQRPVGTGTAAPTSSP